MSRVNDVVKNVIKIICALISTYLFLMTSFSNCYDGYSTNGDGYLMHFHYKDHLIIIIALSIAFFIVFRRAGVCLPKMNNDSFWSRIDKNRWIIYILYFILGAVFVFTTRLRPISDPEKCYNVAKALIDGDFADYFEYEGYMFRCPHQNGLVLFDVLLLKIFGDYAYLTFQYINIFFEILAIEYIGRIAEIINDNDASSGIKTRVLLVLFPVWFFNITYNYGLVISTTMVIIALYYEMRFLCERRCKYILLSSLSISFGIVIKLNATVFMIGMLLFLLWDLLLISRDYRNIVFILAIILLRILAVNTTNGIMESITGYETSHGIPALNYIAMGISGNGTYSGKTIDIFRASGWDVSVSNDLAVKDIKNTILTYYNDKSRALTWLGRKLSLEWANPAFGALRKNTGRGEFNKLGEFWRIVFEQDITGGIVTYLNIFEGIIFLGIMYFAIKYKNKNEYYKIMLMVCLIGGFVFHVFWEGAFDYVMPYYIVALPCATEGLRLLGVDLSEGEKTPLFIYATLVAFLILAKTVHGGVIFDTMIRIIDTEEVLSSYVYSR